MSMASSAGGSGTPASAERPGDGLDQRAPSTQRAAGERARAATARHARHRDGVSPGRSAGGRTGSIMESAAARRASRAPIARENDIRVSLASWTTPSETQRHRTLQHHLHSRRAGARPGHRRHHHADLPDLDLRAGRPRPAARRASSTAARRTRRAWRSSATSPPSRPAPRRSRSPRAWRPSTPS